MRCSLVLLCVALMGCGGAAPSVRHAPDAPRRCVYVPSRDAAAGAWKEEVSSARAGVHVVLVAAAGASAVAPPAPSPAPVLKGLSGEGLGNGIPRGVLRLVLEGGAGAEVGRREREQQLIDFFGGARSDTGEPYRTENAVRGVAKENPQGRRFHAAATELWGQLHPYTGY